ncbi:MAG: polyphosphate polymerase domain-containing protein [Fluviicola sp.]|nr:polyphosphate polymerase domain-containing protein [Fluviicola sp.]
MPLQQVQNIAKTFDTIGLVDMDSVQLMNRVDTKFVFTLKDLEFLLPQLVEHYFVLDVNGVLLSEYESLYFDDAEFSSYHDHHKKKVNRFKVRYRKYVNSNLAFLEVKHKNKGRTEKSRTRVEDIPSEMSIEDFIFVKNAGITSDAMSPSLMNSFSRITLVSKAMNERLTLDLNLTYTLKDKVEVIENIVIAELKQGKAMRNSPFYQLMKNNLIRPLKISKYTIGYIILYGLENTKYNRFKKKLLKIKKLQEQCSQQLS